MAELSCTSECKFQREGKCTLERAEWAKSSDGAECMSHIFEKESECHSS
ncbi:MAG: hypothetical protein KGZ63_10965 [Clostridiales bacterium]|jgi:hypothetical protein|nr:hypothetical protein [Clostridiales bacterium]